MTQAPAYIVVGYDGSPEATAAADRGAAEAMRRRSVLHIVTCFEPALAGSGPTSITSKRNFDEARSMVDRLRLRVVAVYPTLEVHTTISRGPAYSELREIAGAHDIIVVGVRLRRRDEVKVHENTTQRLVRRALCPVLVVPLASRPEASRVVVGVDGSEDADRAMLWAADEAEKIGADIVVVHAWTAGTFDVNLDSDPDVARIDAAVTLESSLDRLRQPMNARLVDILIEQSPAEALVRVAAADDLLVIGARGRGAPKSPLFGSTVRGVVERSCAAVMVLPARQPGR